MNGQITLSPTDADYRELWQQMPLAQERLKTIVLARLLDEERAKSRDEPKPFNPDNVESTEEEAFTG